MPATHTPNTKGFKAKQGDLVPEAAVLPFLLVTMLFALWGIVGNLNDILIRQFMKSFALSRLQAGLVQSAFYLGYFLPAMPSALFMRRWGYKAGFRSALSRLPSGRSFPAGGYAEELRVLPLRTLCDRGGRILP